MAINRDKPDRWKDDVLQSVDLYNDWFMSFAPDAFRRTRVSTAHAVRHALKATANMTDISPELLAANPGILSMLRMTTCPPIARDRLIGLAGVSPNLVGSMEDAVRPRVPARMSGARLNEELDKISGIIRRMADPDIFV